MGRESMRGYTSIKNSGTAHFYYLLHGPEGCCWFISMRQTQPNGRVAYKCGNIQVPVCQPIYFLRCVWYCTAVSGACYCTQSHPPGAVQFIAHDKVLYKNLFSIFGGNFILHSVNSVAISELLRSRAQLFHDPKFCIPPFVSHVQPLLSHRIYKLTSSPTAVSHWAGTLLSFQGEWLLNTGLVELRG